MNFADELEALLEKATPGPWAVWDSCSFRRITHRADGDVISGCVQHSDGHPDLRAKREDLDLLCVLRNHAPALLDVVREARSDHSHYVKGCPMCEALRRLDEAEGENG